MTDRTGFPGRLAFARFAAAAAVAMSALVPCVSSAAPVSGTWTFTATGIPGAAGAVLDGSFSSSYDDAANATLAVTVNYLHLFPGYTGTVGGFYIDASDSIVFGFVPAGSLTPNANDFRLSFSPATDPISETFVITRVGSTSMFAASDVTVTFTPDDGTGTGSGSGTGTGTGNTVPEPSSLALAGLALFAAGVGRRRGRASR